MSMDLLGLGKTGLRAAQVQLEITSSNVANVDTPGYTRRSANLLSQSTDSRGYPEYREFGGGIGVRVAGISRGYDQFLTGDVRAASARAADTSARAGWSARIETALGTRDNGVSAGLTDFLGSAELLAAAPSNRPLRAGFLAAAHDLAASFRETAARLEAIDSGVAGSL
ncbi:MAG: flagellar basal body protein, partial [Pacificimonas sp.]